MEKKCYMCGEKFVVEKGDLDLVCDECDKLSGCCGAEVVNGRCNFCKENV